MILGPQPQVTSMQAPPPVIGGQPIQTSPQVASMVGQPMASAPTPSNPASGLNLQALQGILAQQNAKNQPNTPGQTFNGMLGAGATPAQALQVSQAPNGATDDYTAGYTGPAGASQQGLLASLMSMFGSNSGGAGGLASMFGGSGGGGQ
jgi:hypothetical protein